MATKTPRPDLAITDRGRPKTSRALLSRVVAATLSHCERPDMPVSLLLTDDEEIAQVQGQFLDDPTPTDVISFELDGGAELVVSTETAARTAGEFGHDVAAEVALYVVHGLLHCCGYDDHGDKERARMRRAERAVLDALQLQVREVD